MLEFENVSKSFWTGKQRKVILDRVSFRVELGNSLGILAPNGTGKTTLINMMAGLEKPDEGAIYRGCRISFPLGFMGGLVPRHTAMENTRYIARLYDLDPDYVESFCRWMCGIEEYFDMPVMTMKPKAKKFRIRTGEETAAPQPDAQPAAVDPSVAIDAIRREGLTGRQLRMARRVAQKQGLAVTSDFDAVRQLRDMGVDPFQRNTILELVKPESGEAAATPATDRVQLPQTIAPKGTNLPAVEQMSPAERRANEITQIQRDIARRRKRRLALLVTRLTAFVFLPTLIVGWYFAFIATPMFATKSEFIIQQAESGASAAGGLGGLFQGTSMATQQDSITVQSYLASRAAMIRLDGDFGFKDHFSKDNIDAIQRLEDGATNEAAFKIYNDKVKLSYDPTEGILRMEVIAADPETSQMFSEALIGYAEEQVDQLTQRLREDQMAGARSSFEAAQQRRSDALDILTNLQVQSEVIDPISESSALLSRVTSLEIERDSAMITLEEIRKAEENYQTELLMLQQAQAQMESAQIEASRQVRYLSLGVEPVAPDEATYPRVFENTALAFLIFAGAYLMFSLTASILREQVSS